MVKKLKKRFVVPDGYKLVRIRTKTDRIKELGEEIKRFDVVEPSDAELISWGKDSHPFYLEKPFLDGLRDEKKRLEK